MLLAAILGGLAIATILLVGLGLMRSASMADRMSERWLEQQRKEAIRRHRQNTTGSGLK